MFDNLREDLRRYGTTRRARLSALLTSPGAWATVGYRFSRWVETTPVPGGLGLPLKAIARAVNLAVVVATQIQIPPTASIGPGLFIAHTGYIVLATHVKMGRHCTITQGVTIGHRGGHGESQADNPSLGDRVYIGPGAVVLGSIEVGDDSLIAPGAVVTKSLPCRAVVVGNPARVTSCKGAFELVEYPGMETDPERAASLALAEGG